MEKTSALIGNIYSSTQEYVQLQAKSAKLEFYERTTNVISSGISSGLILLFGFFAFTFINVGAAYWLSEELQSTKLGFFVLGGFYFVILALYLIFRDKLFHNKVKNIVLHKISKHMNDYDLMMQEQEIVHAQVAAAEDSMKGNFTELKENLHTIKEDISNIKEAIKGNRNHKGEEVAENNNVGSLLPRIAITSAIDFVMQNLLFKKAGFIKKMLLPIVTNALVTSTVFKEDKKTSLVENLKLKISKAL